MLTIARWACHKILPYLQVQWSWPGGVIGFVLVVSFLCAAATEWIGVHSILGAFLAGVAIGDSHHLRERTRETIQSFINSIFAPLFFASIGLGINVLTAFDPVVVVVVLVLACVGKVGGCVLGARLAKLTPREAWAVGFGMAAQGTMGVILGELAYSAGLIEPKMFVAIITVALVTSIFSGPLIQKALGHGQQRVLSDVLSEKLFAGKLKGRSLADALREMAERASGVTKIPAEQIFDAVWAREQIMHTGIGHGLAVPHARLVGLKKSMVVIGRSLEGIDFDAPDGEPAHLICMILTPDSDPQAQIDLLAMFANAFHDDHSRHAAMAASNYMEFLAAAKLPGEELKAKPENPPPAD
jgi:mannitol/fructose-specific phosphotransferase system IIA component (Ntr-type)